MRVLSLFGGMACGYIAFRELGYEPSRYVAYEIDKYAIKVASHNFPGIEQRGDVFDADFTEFEGFDWLVGGSPCTYWSIAQKNNRETEASGMGWGLFSQYVRALRETKPKYFLYENNKSMSKAIRQSITETFGFEPICINSALVSAQNRQRLYWVGIRQDDGSYKKADIEQPADRGILLKDILQDGCVEKDKAYCLKHQAGNARDYFKKHHTNVKFEPVNPISNGKSRTVTAGYANKGVKHILDSNISENPHKQIFDSVAETIMFHEPHGYFDGGFKATEKCNTLTANGSHQNNHKLLERCAIAVEFDGETPTKAISAADGKVYTVYAVNDGFITYKGKLYPISLADGYCIIRKLTVLECMRLQTVPEWYQFKGVISDSQAYKCLGNGWTVEVIKHLIEGALK